MAASLEFYLIGIGLSILTVIGVIGIVLSITILVRIRTAFAYSLIGLSIFDFLFLLSSLITYGPPVITGSQFFSDDWMQIWQFFNDFVQTGSIYFTMLIATERFLILYFPFHPISDQSSALRRTYVWTTVIIATVLIQLFKYLEYSPILDEDMEACGVNVSLEAEPEPEGGDGAGGAAVIYYYVDYYVHWPYIMTSIAIPFITLFILNSLVFYRVQHSIKFRARSASRCATTVTASAAIAGSSEGSCKIVLMIVAIFLVCQAGCILVIVARHFMLCFFLSWGSELFAIDIFMLDLNSSLNFFIYWAYGSKFRAELKNIFHLK